VPIALFNILIKAQTQAQTCHEVQVFVHSFHLHSEVAFRMYLKALRVPVQNIKHSLCNHNFGDHSHM